MIDPQELKPVGDPETVVNLPNGESLIGLHIKGVPHGPQMLGIREDRDGQPVSCALGVALDTHPYRHNAEWRPEEDGA